MTANIENATTTSRSVKPDCLIGLESDFLANRDILESELIATGKRGARDTRYARGEKWSEIEGIAAVLASALRDG